MRSTRASRHNAFRACGEASAAARPPSCQVIRACQDLPGQELFQYIDGDGEARDVTSSDVNTYLRDISGEDITAKDFRTWHGTVLAAFALQEFESCSEFLDTRCIETIKTPEVLV